MCACARHIELVQLRNGLVGAVVFIVWILSETTRC